MGTPLIGLCTVSFVLARAGLMQGQVTCVRWFHRAEFRAEFPQQRMLSNHMYAMDREQLTCAGGTSVAHLAAALVDAHSACA